MYQGSGDATTFIIMIIVLAIVNFIPSFIAYSRDHPNRLLILVINLLMGWTVIGWAILMYWSLKGGKTPSIA